MCKIRCLFWLTSEARDNLAWANFGEMWCCWWSWLCALSWCCGGVVCPFQNPRVSVRNVSVCTFKTSFPVYSGTSDAGSHGDVLNVHTETFWTDTRGFSACHTTPHRTHTTTQDTRHNTQDNTTTTTTTTTTTHGDRDRDRQRIRKKGREDEIRKTTRKTRDEKMKDKTREGKREDPHVALNCLINCPPSGN